MTTMMTPGSAFASDGGEDLKRFLVGFWNFRTEDATAFILWTVLPILLPYLLFTKLQKDKTIVQTETLKNGGWIDFMAERGLNVNDLSLVQLNSFVRAAELGRLDDAMVQNCVDELKLSAQWKKSTVNLVDERTASATRRARARAILEMQQDKGARR